MCDSPVPLRPAPQAGWKRGTRAASFLPSLLTRPQCYMGVCLVQPTQRPEHGGFLRDVRIRFIDTKSSTELPPLRESPACRGQETGKTPKWAVSEHCWDHKPAVVSSPRGG